MSNSGARVLELRALVRSRRGMVQRANDARNMLAAKIRQCEAEISAATAELQDMGALRTVRRP